MKKILVTGAQFNNKGAQSMLFSVMDQFRRHYGEIQICYVPLDDFRKYDGTAYKFEPVNGGVQARRYANAPLWLRGILSAGKTVLHPLIKRDSLSLREIQKLRRVLSEADALVDISGYNLSSKCKWATNLRFLETIELAQKFGLKTILLPQSFGPFDYGDHQEMMDHRIPQTLAKADLLFAREAYGKRLLEDKYGLTNVTLSPDLVLQSDRLDWHNILDKAPETSVPKLSTAGNVGIIPNAQTFRHGSREQILSIYERIIRQLLESGKNVYIFRHSNDLEQCKQIYAKFASDENVFLIENEFDCWEYSEFVRQFDFLIASRYHSIIHAYKEGVPALILGWAVKYQELAEKFGQSEYIFDITESCDTDALLASLSKLSSDYAQESRSIAESLGRLRGNSCFDACWALLDKGTDEESERSK